MIRVCFGYHRSGSSWTSRLLEEACARLGLRFAVLHDAGGISDLGAWAQERRIQVLAWTNTDGRRIGELGALVGAHVVRDPRDVVVSAYWSHKLSHPTEGMDWLPAHREELLGLSLEDGLLAEVRCRSLQFEQLMAWPGCEGVEEFRFEELVQEPQTQVPRLLRALDLVGGGLFKKRLSHEDAVAIADAHRFQLLAGGRTAGTEDVSHHYRRGTPGDWRRVLGNEHLALIQATWPDLIPRWNHGGRSVRPHDVSPAVGAPRKGKLDPPGT